jgi:oligopeptide/dipeptide ABC transporter ATP-binding protein
LCQRVVVMHAGRVVESALIGDLFAAPQHPYTKSLLAAVPRLHGYDPSAEADSDEADGSTFSNSDGTRDECHFRTRCPMAFSRCADVRPRLVAGRNGHLVACHAVERDALAVATAEIATQKEE